MRRLVASFATIIRQKSPGFLASKALAREAVARSIICLDPSLT
ncbi:MAG: hypothetical protein ACRD4S_12145 [Candidatus Acidiferrales bacterium]